MHVTIPIPAREEEEDSKPHLSSGPMAKENGMCRMATPVGQPPLLLDNRELLQQLFACCGVIPLLGSMKPVKPPWPERHPSLQIWMMLKKGKGQGLVGRAGEEDKSWLP